MAFSGYRFHALPLFFLEKRRDRPIKRMQFFLSPLLKRVKRGNLLDLVVIHSNSCVLVILFIEFFLDRVSFEGKVLEKGEKLFRRHNIPADVESNESLTYLLQVV